jgi:hypothetical protein
MKNIEMTTADGIAIESAKPSFGENLKELAGRAKEVALEKFSDLKDRGEILQKGTLRKFLARQRSG